MIQLTRGQLTSDPQLDRVIHFDPRSKDYPIMQLISATTPRSYTWGLNLVLDQGHEGSCVGNGFAHELAAKPVIIKNVDEPLAVKIYNLSKQLDEYDGENYSGTSVLGGAKAATQLGYYKEYRWAFGLDEMVMAVGHKGCVVVGTNWYTGMDHMDGEGFIRATGTIRGGHCYVIRGVDIKHKAFLGTNSWGAAWGQNGAFKISFEDMDKLLREQGECCIPVLRVKL